MSNSVKARAARAACNAYWARHQKLAEARKLGRRLRAKKKRDEFKADYPELYRATNACNQRRRRRRLAGLPLDLAVDLRLKENRHLIPNEIRQRNH